MQKTILMASGRNNGKDEILAGTDVPLSEQTKKLESLFATGSKRFGKAGVYYLSAKNEVRLPDVIEPKQPTQQHIPMKKIIAILFAALLTLSASAQNNGYVTLASPTWVAAAATTNSAQVIDVTKQASVAVQVSMTGMTGITNGVQTLTFDWSNDRSTWTTTTKTVAVTPNTNVAVIVLTNLPTYGARFMRLKSWANGDSAAAVTNISVNYAIKVGAP